MGLRFLRNQLMMAVVGSCICVAASAPEGVLGGREAEAKLRQDGAYHSLEQALSRALYAVDASGHHVYSARNAAHRFEIRFQPSETRLAPINSRDTGVSLRLVGYGYGARLLQPERATLVSASNRMEYRRGPLVEWYVNDARGLEQGFTLTAKPGIASLGGPLAIELEFTGALRPELNAPGDVALLDSVDRALLHYGNLAAWDATKRPLPSRLEVQGRALRLVVEDAGAQYPITIDPLVTATTLQAADGTSADQFGHSISLSGNTVIVGANLKNSLQGAAYIFVQSGTTWSQQAKLTASDGAEGDRFGASVSVSGDIVIVGAGGKSSAQGAAYVFVRANGLWIQQAELTAADGASGDHFGVSVSVNGTTAVIGAATASGSGAAYVFVQSGTSWTQQSKLTAADGAAGDLFGGSVSLNGGSAVVGAPGAMSGQGAAYAFLQSGSTWAQQAKLTASDGAAGDSFGYSVSLSGNTAAIGAVGKASGQGGAYVFARSGTNWNPQATLAASDGMMGDSFGRSVSIDGDTVVVGANALFFNTGAAYVFVSSGASWSQQAKIQAQDKTQSFQFAFSVAVNGDIFVAGAPIQYNAQGEAYFFTRASANWTQQAELGASDAANPDHFGWSVALSGDTALVGANFKQHFQGAAYIFVRSAGAWTQQAKLLPADAAGGDFGQAVAIDKDTAVIGAYLQNQNAGAAYIFVCSGTSWTQQAKLTAPDGASNDLFGTSVAVSGDSAVVGAPGHNSSQGAVYVFMRSGTTWSQQATPIPTDASKGDSLGSAVAIQGDTMVAAGYGKNNHTGAAYVFVRSGTTWTQQSELNPADNPKFAFFGYSANVDSGTVVVGAPYGGNGSAYVYVQSGTSWAEQAKLTPPASETGGLSFGYAVALEGDVIAVGSPSAEGEGAIFVYSRLDTTWTEVTKLTAATGPGDNEGWSVALNGGTIVAGAIGQVAGRGAAYVFPLPIISAGGIVHAASFAQTVAPGSIASGFGINFAAAATPASTLPLPTTLGGVSLTINGTPAPLIYVNNLQANFQVPYETTPGPATVVVTANGIPGPPATVTVAALAPGIFVAGTNQAVVLNLDNSLADSGHPAKVGSIVIMYVTGLGALDHPIPTGSPASANPVSNAKVVPTVTVGGANATVQFAGMTPSFVGLSQINFVVPKVASGSQPVVVMQGGQTSNNPVMSVSQ